MTSAGRAGALDVVEHLRRGDLGSDHLVAMHAGRVVAQGAPADVVTPDLVRRLYGVEATVVRDPAVGCSVVVPLRLAR